MRATFLKGYQKVIFFNPNWSTPSPFVPSFFKKAYPFYTFHFPVICFKRLHLNNKSHIWGSCSSYLMSEKLRLTVCKLRWAKLLWVKYFYISLAILLDFILWKIAQNISKWHNDTVLHYFTESNGIHYQITDYAMFGGCNFRKYLP